MFFFVFFSGTSSYCNSGKCYDEEINFCYIKFKQTRQSHSIIRNIRLIVLHFEHEIENLRGGADAAIVFYQSQNKECINVEIRGERFQLYIGKCFSGTTPSKSPAKVILPCKKGNLQRPSSDLIVNLIVKSSRMKRTIYNVIRRWKTPSL